jgi:hypothetical protein
MVVRKPNFSFGMVMVMTITLTQVRDKRKFKELELRHANGEPNETLLCVNYKCDMTHV